MAGQHLPGTWPHVGVLSWKALHLLLANTREADGQHPHQVGPPSRTKSWSRSHDGAFLKELCGAFQKVVLRLLKFLNIFEFSGATYNMEFTHFHRLKVIPHVKDFIKHYDSKYTPNELLRMELAILDKLHWDRYTRTPMEFLVIFHAETALDLPQVKKLQSQRKPSLHVESLTRQLQHCMAGHQLLQFKGSTLALVIITLELERLMPDCCAPIFDLLKKAQTSALPLS